MQQLQPLIISLIIETIISVFFCLTLTNTIKQVNPDNRQINSGLIWLLIIPLFNIVWNFVVIPRLSASIKNELLERGYEVDENPGFTLGMAYAILPFLAILQMPLTVIVIIGIIRFIIFIQYWTKINWYKKVLKEETSEEVTAE